MATKKSVKKSSVQKQSKMPIEAKLAITAIVLPFIAWLLGSLGNPTGWSSHNPSLVVIIPLFFIVSAWPIALSLILLMVVYLYYRALTFKNVSVVLLIMSVLYSAYLFQMTITADETEFTG